MTPLLSCIETVMYTISIAVGLVLRTLIMLGEPDGTKGGKITRWIVVSVHSRFGQVLQWWKLCCHSVYCAMRLKTLTKVPLHPT